MPPSGPGWHKVLPSKSQYISPPPKNEKIERKKFSKDEKFVKEEVEVSDEISGKATCLDKRRSVAPSTFLC
jgi:hypothetical protein